mmetsp:Transcript_11177/g.30501  ORF Transcript_11177/g.30501 Transcript_11177/m.30501 type:complete len:144 (-) Transcript_11177:1467-1898(-)
MFCGSSPATTSCLPSTRREHSSCTARTAATSESAWKSKFYGVVLHAIDAPPARWRGGVGSSPLDGTPDTLVDFHTVIDVGEVEGVLHIYSNLHDAVVKKRREHGRDQTREVVPLAHLVVVVVALVPIDKREGVDEDEEQHAEN